MKAMYYGDKSRDSSSTFLNQDASATKLQNWIACELENIAR